MSVGVGASSGPGIGSDEEKPSICQRTIESSWQARERMRSPWKATLFFSGVRVSYEMGMEARGLPVDEVVVDFGGGKVRVLEHEGDVEVIGWELWECPLRCVRSRVDVIKGEVR
jgi:hypothetical protein